MRFIIIMGLITILQQSVLAQHAHFSDGGARIQTDDKHPNRVSGKLAADTYETSLPTPGEFPSGLTWDGSCFWFSDMGPEDTTFQLFRMKPNGEIIRSFQVPQVTGHDGFEMSSGLEWDGTHLWLVDEQAGLLFQIDTTQGEAITVYELADNASADPNDWGVAFDGAHFWTSQFGDTHYIYEHDVGGNQVESVYEYPDPGIGALEYVNGYIWAISASATMDDSSNYTWNSALLKIDPSDGSIVDSTELAVAAPMGLAWDGENLWCMSGSEWFGGNQRIEKITTGAFLQTRSRNATSLIDQYSISVFPNPFNPTTTIQFDLQVATDVRLAVYDLLGREIVRLVEGHLEAGYHHQVWNASDRNGREVPTGIYFVVVMTPEFRKSIKTVLLK